MSNAIRGPGLGALGSGHVPSARGAQPGARVLVGTHGA